MIQGCKSFCLGTLKLQLKVQSRCMGASSKAEIRKRRNLIFDEEKRSQRAQLGRIEKIQVKYKSTIDEVVLVMNKGISTPYDCSKHISEGVAKVSALALVDGSVWDMQRPLSSSCELNLINLQSPSIRAVNTAFWRTCSFLLGAVVDTAFKSEIEVHLHSFPKPLIKSGSFTYDVYLNLPNWQPNDPEMRAMSAQFVKLSNKELPLERLETTEEIALDMFQENPFKSQQIPDIAKGNDNKITLYRVGDHIDISKGPMVGNTSLIGRCTVTAVHKVPDAENFYRFQGIAIPKGNLLNSFAYSILEDRARKLNRMTWVHETVQDDVDDDPIKIAVKN